MLRKIFSKKSLIWSLAVDDLTIRYKSSVLGFFWSILEPLLMLTVLYFIFTHVFKSQIEHYQLYLLLGIILWSFFARATSLNANVFLAKANIINKINIPREVFVISTCITVFLMMMLEFIILAIFFVVFQFIPPYSIVILVGILFLVFILALGVSFVLSVLNVLYRDIQYIWGVVTYAGFFSVPILYSYTTFPENVQSLLLLNPMAQIIEIGHNVSLYGILPEWQDMLYTVIISFGILVGGYLIFKFYEFRVVEEL